MSINPQRVLAIFLLCVAGYCGFGLLATLEPMDRNVLAWRVGYALAIVASLGGFWYLWLRRRG